MKTKHIIPTLLLISVLMAGCSGTPDPKPRDGNGIETASEYHIIVIDGCEYIYMGYVNSQAITHKGNCNNPIHKK